MKNTKLCGRNAKGGGVSFPLVCNSETANTSKMPHFLVCFQTFNFYAHQTVGKNPDRHDLHHPLETRTGRGQKTNNTPLILLPFSSSWRVSGVSINLIHVFQAMSPLLTFSLTRSLWWEGSHLGGFARGFRKSAGATFQKILVCVEGQDRRGLEEWH